jgi:hypothetical protein
MAEQEEARSDGSCGQQPDPENGPVETVVLLCETTKSVFRKHLADIFQCIVDNIRAKHLPSAKLLIDLMKLLKVEFENDAPEQEFPSLAEMLSKAWQEQELESGTKN